MEPIAKPFSAAIEPAIALGRRRSQRAPVSLDARIGRGGLDRALCRVIDLSLHGARLQTYSALRAGAAIFLTLPHIGHVEATVRWADDFTAGCEFAAPLSEAQFQTLVA